MSADLPNQLAIYLVPFLVIVGLAILLCVLGNRDGDDPAVLEPRLDDEPKPMREPSLEPAPVPLILVVDDSAVARVKLNRLFANAGFQVLQAKDGIEALNLLGQHRVALMVTDLEMPNMDGFDLIATVQAAIETEHIPIIAITGNDELQARIQDIQGLFGIFRKPWNDRVLLKRVELLVANRA